MSERDRDLPDPPPGGFLRDPGPAGPESAEQEAIQRIAEALEGVRSELHAIRRVLERMEPPRD
jgi:hypothetical protein